MFFSTGPYRSIFISHSVTIGTSVLVINSSTISLLENSEKKPVGLNSHKASLSAAQVSNNQLICP